MISLQFDGSLVADPALQLCGLSSLLPVTMLFVAAALPIFMVQNVGIYLNATVLTEYMLLTVCMCCTQY